VREGRWSRERDGDLPRFCDSSNVGQNARLRATLPASPPAQHIPGSCSLACPPGEGEGHDHAVVPPQPTEGRDHGLFKDTRFRQFIFNSGIGLFYAESGFFDGKNLDFWRIGSKPFLWRILKTGEKARFRNVIEPL